MTKYSDQGQFKNDVKKLLGKIGVNVQENGNFLTATLKTSFSCSALGSMHLLNGSSTSKDITINLDNYDNVNEGNLEGQYLNKCRIYVLTGFREGIATAQITEAKNFLNEKMDEMINKPSVQLDLITAELSKLRNNLKKWNGIDSVETIAAGVNLVGAVNASSGVNKATSKFLGSIGRNAIREVNTSTVESLNRDNPQGGGGQNEERSVKRPLTSNLPKEIQSKNVEEDQSNVVDPVHVAENPESLIGAVNATANSTSQVGITNEERVETSASNPEVKKGRLGGLLKGFNKSKQPGEGQEVVSPVKTTENPDPLIGAVNATANSIAQVGDQTEERVDTPVTNTEAKKGNKLGSLLKGLNKSKQPGQEQNTVDPVQAPESVSQYTLERLKDDCLEPYKNYYHEKSKESNGWANISEQKKAVYKSANEVITAATTVEEMGLIMQRLVDAAVAAEKTNPFKGFTSIFSSSTGLLVEKALEAKNMFEANKDKVQSSEHDSSNKPG